MGLKWIGGLLALAGLLAACSVFVTPTPTATPMPTPGPPLTAKEAYRLAEPAIRAWHEDARMLPSRPWMNWKLIPMRPWRSLFGTA
ncbi:MAG: hypothetical protein B6I35_08285 [Anaerolineaceae bacterium 4572_32.2]|nr:MAG: hypothetical protein B6I35_08285 [Anaerolineaceae bacterium 4572_32.2]